MPIFNVRLDEEIQSNINKVARAKRVNKSEIVREALSEYFREGEPHSAGDYDECDDWSEFAGAVLESQRKIVSKAIDRLSEDDWGVGVELVYAKLREKVVEKSRAYGNYPALHHTPSKSAKHTKPEIIAIIGFASDDVHEIRVELEQVFFEYAWSYGDEAFAALPTVWEAAKARLEAGETEPTREQSMAARGTRAL